MKVLMNCTGMNIELRPFTDMMPKCLLSIKTKSILFHNLEWLQKYDIDEVIVATKYHHNQIELALNKYQIEILFSSDLKINTHKLSKCVGTAQTLKSLSHKLDGGDFLFLDGDNLYNFDIENYYNVHKNNGKIISILSHMTMEDGKYKNFIKYKNGSDKIEKIIVKPEYKLNKQLLATSGACYLNPMIFNVIGNKDMCLFDNVIPKQLDNISVILDNDSVQFINTKQQYMSMSKNMEFV
jgi:NDP-sugar pyrophosphorylase family protein